MALLLIYVKCGIIKVVAPKGGAKKRKVLQ